MSIYGSSLPTIQQSPTTSLALAHCAKVSWPSCSLRSFVSLCSQLVLVHSVFPCHPCMAERRAHAPCRPVEGTTRLRSSTQ